MKTTSANDLGRPFSQNYDDCEDPKLADQGFKEDGPLEQPEDEAEWRRFSAILFSFLLLLLILFATCVEYGNGFNIEADMQYLYYRGRHAVSLLQLCTGDIDLNPFKYCYRLNCIRSKDVRCVRSLCPRSTHTAVWFPLRQAILPTPPTHQPVLAHHSSLHHPYSTSTRL